MNAVNGRWLYKHLAPFLKRMSWPAARAALMESLELGHISKRQLEGIWELWAANHHKHAQKYEEDNGLQ